eukprot:9387247-Ditylum_brightwellii.AAC.1
MEQKEIGTKEKLKKVCLEEVSRCSRMSEDTPLMIVELAVKLQYHGMTEYSDQILCGTAETIIGLEGEVKSYMREYEAMSGELPPKEEPISFSDFLQECKRIRERTSSGSSITMPAMVKTKALDPMLGRAAWHASNFPWCSRYSLE